MDTNSKAIINLLENTSPEIVKIARWASLAARVEPELIRTIRLHFLPETNAGVEADLWFSPLVEASSPLGLMFHPEILFELRKELASEANGLSLEKVWEIIQFVHEDAPPAIRLEEKVTYLALKSAPQDMIDEALLPVVAALLERKDKGTARWVRRILPRLPENVKATPAAQILDIQSSVHLGQRILLGNPSSESIRWLEWIAPSQMERTTIGVRLIELRGKSRWEFSNPPALQSHVIEAPKTDPLIIEMSWKKSPGKVLETKQIFLPLSDLVTTPNPNTKITIRTGIDKSYIFTPHTKENKRRQKLSKESSKDFQEIGGSPIPGLTLSNLLRGHTDAITQIAYSPDGHFMASSSDDKTIRIWDLTGNESSIILREHDGDISCVTWSPNGNELAAGSEDNAIYIWETNNWRLVHKIQKHLDNVSCLEWSPDGKFLASGSFDNTVRIWGTETYSELLTFDFHENRVRKLAWSPDSTKIASAGDDKLIHVWNPSLGQLLGSCSGHADWVRSVVWLPNNQEVISCSDDATIRLWNTNTGQQSILIEGHTGPITSISLSVNGDLLASKSVDETIKIWHTDSWQNVATYAESTIDYSDANLVFHPKTMNLATLGNNDQIIRSWEINLAVLVGLSTTENTFRYTTAKIVLVGDAGVGKTGLGWRLAHNEFKQHSSTHGQQFWVVPELKKTREDGTECEAVLWDLAGQPDYRLIHSLYLDDVDTALVLFDPTNRQDPLSGVDFWLNQLKDKDKNLRNSILVGARTDRGTSTLTSDELRAYCERNGISGGYIPVSAMSGDGLDELIERLKSQIPWEQMTATVTTLTFKKIKEFVLGLKEDPKRNFILVQPDGLRRQLQATDRDWIFSDAELMTAISHLETHGYIKIIHKSNGDNAILLAPDVLANLASSIVLEARRNPRGLGVLEEARLIEGSYSIQELNNLSEDERKTLIDAAISLFLEKNVCFRETFNQLTFLVFPSLINEKRPIDESIKTIEGESYRVRGAVENLYASLVVLLGYTNTFTRTQQWQNQAQYEMGEGEICGFVQSEYQHGEIELILYYGEDTPDPIRLMFRGLFERFISRRELDIARYQPVVCHNCGTPLARNVVIDQLSKEKDFSFCHECGNKVSLPSSEPLTPLSPKEEAELDAQQAIAQHRTAFEAALVRIKGLLRDKKRGKKPSCFISYAWGVPKNERWVLQLAKDLRNADIDVLLDRWDSLPGSNLDLYIDRILSSDFVIPVGTPELRKKYDTKEADPVIAAELKLINLRVRQPTKYGDTVLPVLLTGTAKTSFTPQLQPLVSVDFRESEFYFRKLFDMIWRLYDLPFDNPLLEELQASMTPQTR